MNRFHTPHDQGAGTDFLLHLTRRQAEMCRGFSTDSYENHTKRHPVTVVIPRNNLRDLSKALHREAPEMIRLANRRIANTLYAVVEDALDAYDCQIDINAAGNQRAEYPTDEQRDEVINLAEELDVQDPAAVVDCALEIGAEYGHESALHEACRAYHYDQGMTHRRPLPLSILDTIEVWKERFAQAIERGEERRARRAAWEMKKAARTPDDRAAALNAEDLLEIQYPWT